MCCMCIYIYIYACIHIQLYTDIYIYICTCIYSGEAAGEGSPGREVPGLPGDARIGNLQTT